MLSIFTNRFACSCECVENSLKDTNIL